MVFLVSKAKWQQCNPKLTEQSAKSENKWDFVCFKPCLEPQFQTELALSRWDHITVMPVTSLAAVSDTGAFEHLLQLTGRTLVFYSSCHVTEAVDVVSGNVHDISPLLNFCNASKKSKKTANVCRTRMLVRSTKIHLFMCLQRYKRI